LTETLEPPPDLKTAIRRYITRKCGPTRDRAGEELCGRGGGGKISQGGGKVMNLSNKRFTPAALPFMNIVVLTVGNTNSGREKEGGRGQSGGRGES